MIYYSAAAIVLVVVLLLLKKPSTPTRKEIALERLSRLWTEEQPAEGLQVEASKEETKPETKSEETREAEKPAWEHHEIAGFYDTHIEPWRKVLAHGRYLDAIESILSYLDRFGDCPSVVQNKSDTEYTQMQSVYDVLASVTLVEHSLNTAEKIIAIVKKAGTKDFEFSLGKMLIASLGHDLGKIPELRKDPAYATGDHPIISYSVLDGILPASLAGRDEILKAVRDHHYRTKDGFTELLRQADHEARNMELKARSAKAAMDLQKIEQAEQQKEEQKTKTKTMLAGPPDTIDLSWLDTGELLRRIEPVINVVERGWFSAFSTRDGVVYVQPQLVSQVVIDMAKASGRLEYGACEKDTLSRRRIEYTVTNMLREKGLIPGIISEGYSGARFGLVNKSGKQVGTGFYTPVKAEAFGTGISELEERRKKSAKLSAIDRVRPLFGK